MEKKPLVIAQQGHFWTGVEEFSTHTGTIAVGAMSVQYQIPYELKCPFPIIFIHGGGGQGCEFFSTPDGRPGWAQYFLSQGFATYIVDRAGHGRSPFLEGLGQEKSLLTYEIVRDLFTHPTPEMTGEYAKFAKNWPSEDALDQFMAGVGPVIGSLEKTEDFARKGGAELLKKIGPAILITHSMGSPCGWVIADECPNLIKGIIAIEPLGPPFSEPFSGLGSLKWGITAQKIAFSPEADSPEILKNSNSIITGLNQIPIAVVTAEGSFMNNSDPLTVEFLQNHGASVEHIQLAQHGIHGNGHFMIGETNSDEIAKLLEKWIYLNLPNKANDGFNTQPSK